MLEIRQGIGESWYGTNKSILNVHFLTLVFEQIENMEIKDVKLPLSMQRSMAAEAEATREANAKVIAAAGEKKASVALLEAAINMEKSPGALQLRYLQTLNVVAAENNSTIIFPIPMDFFSLLKNKVR